MILFICINSLFELIFCKALFVSLFLLLKDFLIKDLPNNKNEIHKKMKKKNTINQIKKKNKPIRNTQNSSTLICTALFQYKYVYLVQGKLSLYTRQHFWNQQMNQTTIMVQINGSKGPFINY